jgi:hypothetical protein
MTQVENYGQFQVFIDCLMSHVWTKSPLLCLVVRWGKTYFQSCTLASRECKAEARVISKSHCGTEDCKRCRVEDVHLRETGGIDFSKASFSCNSQCSLENIFFLTHSVEISFMHGTSNFQLKFEIDPNFQLVSHLWFIVLWWSQH